MKSHLKIRGALLATTTLVSPIAANAQDAETTNPALSFQPTYSDEIVVRGRNIPEPQRATSQVATFLNADDLDRTGDDNAALALTRLSGLSVVGGKFAYVRGLGDRYSSARLNGSPLPSPEPLRRTVPLDLFPSNVLEGATVQKTFSPNYPGEFGGGIIDLQTLRDPGDSFLNVKLGVGMNTATTSKDGIYVNGGDRDWLGYDDGTRSIPDPLQDVIDAGTPLNDLDDATREAVGESLVNSPLSVIQRGTLGPNFEGSIDGGWSKEVGGDASFGLVGVIGYKSDWTTENSERVVVKNDTIGVDYDTIETSLNTTVNGLLSSSMSWDNHVVQGLMLYIHDTLKQSQIDDGFNFNAPGTSLINVESNTFLERQLWMAQLSGNHIFGDLEANWRGAFARSTRDAPYEQSFRRNRTEDGDLVYSGSGIGREINFSDLTDDSLSGGVDLVYNVPLSGAREATLTLGYEYADSEREFNSYGFRFAGSGANSLPLDTQMARVDFLFSPDNIDPARFELEDRVSDGTASYLGDLTVHGAYFLADAELIPTVRTTAGVRYEDGSQTVGTFDRFGNTGPGSEIKNDYWLPSAMLTWNFTDNMQFRLGYSQTIARPQFRELAASQFSDPDTDRRYRGNSFLVDSKFRNYDARYEYYLGRNQFITASGFYKTIDNPIEEIQFEPSNFNFVTTFINSPKAELYGGEFEYRTRFALEMNDWMANREWLFSVNYTYTKSEIEAQAGDTVTNPFTGADLDASTLGLDGAPLQGTPEHIVNAQFGWEGDSDQFTLLLGWVDERILQRGFPDEDGGLPDIIEQPGIQLDAVFRHNVEIAGTPVTFGFSARNLLGAKHEEFQNSGLGRTEFNTYKRGRSVSASITAKF